MWLAIKTSTNGFGKMTLDYVSTITFLMPLPPLPAFWIKLRDPHSKFVHVIHNIMEGEVMLHLRNPTNRVGTIKFMHIHFREMAPCVVILKWGVIHTQERVWMTIFTLVRGLFIRYFCIGSYVVESFPNCSWIHAIMVRSWASFLFNSSWIPSNLVVSYVWFLSVSLALSSHFTALQVLWAIFGYCKKITRE